MDRRPPDIDPPKADGDETSLEAGAATPDSLSEAKWDRVLPPIDEGDREWQAYEKRMIQEALDDPRPLIPADEAFAQVYAYIEQRRAQGRRRD